MAKPRKVYSKKSSWTKWLIIYLVIGVIVYFLIFYFLTNNNSGNSEINDTIPQQSFYYE